MTAIVISSGHGLKIRGASGLIDEVDEARRVVDQTAVYLQRLGVETTVFHDDVSETQDENLNRIVDFHNAQGPHDLDLSIHFNAYEPTDKAMGTECLYVAEETLAEDFAVTVADAAGFVNRGAKYRDDLFFLNNTVETALLAEICFVDSSADVKAYQTNFDEICKAIAEVVSGRDMADADDEIPPQVDEHEPLVTVGFSGKASWFGGPDDDGVDADEGLAFLYSVEDAPDLFLDEQPAGTTGLARRLDPEVFYLACRWDYDVTPKEMLADQSRVAIVRAKRSGITTIAHPADWGPHEDTGRAADLSPGLLEALKLETDDEVEVLYPAPQILANRR